VKEGCEELKLFVELISFAGEEAMYELVSANRGACSDEDRPCERAAKYGRSYCYHIVVLSQRCNFEGAG
jgi:hypothetical protein